MSDFFEQNEDVVLRQLNTGQKPNLVLTCKAVNSMAHISVHLVGKSRRWGDFSLDW